MIGFIPKKNKLLSIIPTIMLFSICNTYASTSNPNSNSQNGPISIDALNSVTERIRHHNIRETELNETVMQILRRSSSIDAANSDSAEEYTERLNRGYRHNISRISRRRIANSPLSVIITNVIEGGINRIPNLNLEDFDDNSKSVILDANRLHEQFVLYYQEEQIIQRLSNRI